MAHKISIIIPVLGEEKTIQRALSRLSAVALSESAQVVVVDGDPSGGTLSAVDTPGVIKIRAQKGRGSQMNAGARASDGDILLFLHADTYLHNNALVRIVKTLEDPAICGGAFDLGIDSPRKVFRAIEFGASARSRITRTPYGDQAQFIRRRIFFDLGGFADIPIMEDVDLMRRIKRKGLKIRILEEKALTSARRWEKEGVLFCTLRNYALILSFHLGASPRFLARFYP